MAAGHAAQKHTLLFEVQQRIVAMQPAVHLPQSIDHATAKPIHVRLPGRRSQVVVVRTGESGERDDSRRGLGASSFTPAQGESYTLSVTSPPGIPGVALPAALPEGVALTVPGAVVNSGEPVQIVLHAAGTQRQVIVALSCRGSLVAEQALTLQPGATEVTLVPAAGTGGVLRIMVLEAQHEKLQPIAERLIYCLPREALVLGVETDKRAYRPGDRVTLKITNGDEKRQPEQSWLLVSTGKRDALSQASMA